MSVTLTAVSLMARDRAEVGIAHQTGAKVSRDANQFLRDRFAYAVDHDFAQQP